MSANPDSPEVIATTLDGVELVSLAAPLDLGLPVEVAPPPASQGHSSLLGAVLNYVNSIVGAGIIGMPFAFVVGPPSARLLALLRCAAVAVPLYNRRRFGVCMCTPCTIQESRRCPPRCHKAGCSCAGPQPIDR